MVIDTGKPVIPYHRFSASIFLTPKVTLFTPTCITAQDVAEDAGRDAPTILAVELGISIKTVETHRANITAKLGTRRRVDLVRYARAKGLLDSP